jgi:hypothetical protein
VVTLGKWVVQQLLTVSLEIGSESLGYFANVASVGSESQLQTAASKGFTHYLSVMDNDSYVRKGIRAIFLFTRIVPKRSVCVCFLGGKVDLMTSTQNSIPSTVGLLRDGRTPHSLVFSTSTAHNTKPKRYSKP